MLNPRLDKLTDYPFDRLRALLDGIEPPGGVEPLVMTLGEPQHPPPAIIAEELARHANLWGRYPPIDGTPEWRDAVGGWIHRRYGVEDVPVLPASGTREALFMATALAIPETKGGDVPLVLVPNPFYQVYSGSAVMWGAEPRFLPATAETGFLPDFEALDCKTRSRIACAFLCSPANPQGAATDLDYLKSAIELARRHDFVLMVDECYGEIYSDAAPPGALQAAAAMGEGWKNLLVFHSLSKRSSAAGLRSGFVGGDPDLITRFRRLRAYSAATVPMPTLAASAALWNDDSHVADNRALYRAKFDVAERVLDGRFGFRRPEGGFFLWLDVGDGESAARKLWQEAGLRVLPGAYLARDGEDGTNPGTRYVRVALVHDAETVEDGLNRLVATLAR